MVLKDTLFNRLDILMGGGVISEKVSDYSKAVVIILLDENPSLDEDKLTMFITHLAMASQRIIDGKEEMALDCQILKDLEQEPVYEKAVAYRDRILKETDIEFPESECDFLAVHLCNLLS